MSDNGHKMTPLQNAIARALVTGRIPAKPSVLREDSESMEVVEALLNLIDNAVDQGIGPEDAEILTQRAYLIAQRFLRLGFQMKFHDSMGEWFAFETEAMRSFVGVDTLREYADLAKVF